MRTSKIGSVNPCAVATLYDANGNALGTTLDTPNAIAYAMAVNDKIIKAVAHYQFFGDTTRTREQLKDRFSWVVKENEIQSRFLTWN